MSVRPGSCLASVVKRRSCNCNPRCAARGRFQKKVARPGDHCAQIRPNIVPSYAKGLSPASQPAALLGETRGCLWGNWHLPAAPGPNETQNTKSRPLKTSGSPPQEFENASQAFLRASAISSNATFSSWLIDPRRCGRIEQSVGRHSTWGRRSRWLARPTKTSQR
jgi:hypothetical protein